MPVDASAKGRSLPPVAMTVEAGRLAFFAKAIGQADPRSSAPDGRLPVPPTFLFGIELEQPDPFAWLAGLGVDLRHVLHGEQSFTYHSMAYAGDTLVASPRIADIYAKKGGALQFVVKQTAVARDDGTPVADLESVLVIRDPEAAR
ncbi:MaoC family dehydratase N-terminal domain-containing protein [Amycolatopsis echigonensis]|uniref:MaoC dehydratase-like protein n=1 Tax=Amycolatopsis echigonensis TaxID=2576905 RepID=A0A2N3WUD6_9PSEU|nr:MULTISPECIES: MaoC family dehydratase N-terminal domain-containing protein [Amycolatopsis]MBB2503803.1 MaoC family dehydratase N-terminal domain-containing protein [Amycolatopsis echigonensis]PKV97463.1 MaoC dehydratase-like protein [Amycolatopsis niigatensis]